MLKSFISWISGVAVTLGGPGLFVIAFLDSSFISLPLINDQLVVAMSRRAEQILPHMVGDEAGRPARTFELETISKRYPQHQYASMAGLIEGQQAEAEQDFARAAMVYERIAPGAAGHEEGLYRAGNAWSREARKLFAEGKEKEAKDAAQRADALLVKARGALEQAAEDTLETSVQDRMRGLAFNSRLAQADLYLLDGVDRGAEVAALFKKTARSIDYAARYGGDEFLLLLHEVAADDACQLADRVRNAVAAARFGPGDHAVTVSIGVACYPDHGDTAEALIASADAALYRAKRGGRNGIVVARADDARAQR